MKLLRTIRKKFVKQLSRNHGEEMVVSRRLFLQLGALLAVAAYALNPNKLLGSSQTGEFTVYRLSVRGSRVCRACRLHARHKVFSSRGSADSNRAHLGCNCRITEQRISERTFETQFPTQADFERGVIDLRHLPGRAVRAPGTLQGRVRLPGRFNHQGVKVSLSGRESLTNATKSDGTFEFSSLAPGAYVLQAEAPGHLTIRGTVNVVSGQVNSVLDGILPTGDVDQSGSIDDKDAELVVSSMPALGIKQAGADVNADGRVNLLDLALVGRYYGRSSVAQWPGLDP